ncbi:uncharacterized protein L969DRAFT_93050 [Mixia osmundae IAM 14324]|uniref:Protein SYS1 n=1 Tax=Mixia osmundae (strain CBS 9802 / IAM 14324 / JCM 22182 / KY 12970) TaxID=764103 RepID=G7E692_MIXOS|nr:uncharacterized protein L969DRAFT_93050 [Mixia osmundae IAM 14324]KEI40493.1 hypothetical protein L969DRAFT_93050 [Mixia osmundae IAM 14324]GAA98352.1 hypothetical protein E5Q_05038 [Mixia osmundae IAM 14324]
MTGRARGSDAGAPSQFRLQGWDPLLIISQIVSLQAVHYLVLALLIPPLLWMFADPLSLSLEGGASNVAMVMDWREMVGRATIEEDIGALTRLPSSLGRHAPSTHSHWRVSNATRESETEVANHIIAKVADEVGSFAADPLRGYVLGLAWIAASSLDVLFLFHFVRRPTHILDFSLTLLFNHVILTTYYASSFPTSIFFWLVCAVAVTIQIVWAEQLCIRREMRDGLGLSWKNDQRDEGGMGGNAVRTRDTLELKTVNGSKYAQVASDEDR